MRKLEPIFARWWLWAALAAVVAAGGPRVANAVLAAVSEAGTVSPLVFCAVYALASMVGLPGAAFTIAGGFLFGPWAGAVLSGVASTVGACLAFLSGRRLARAEPARELAALPAIRALRSALDEEGFKIVLLARAAPAFPFNPAVYAFALAGMPFRRFAAATLLGAPPCAVAFAYLGGSTAGLAARPSFGWTLSGWLFTAAFLLWLHRMLTRSLESSRGRAFDGVRLARGTARLAAVALREKTPA